MTSCGIKREVVDRPSCKVGFEIFAFYDPNAVIAEALFDLFRYVRFDKFDGIVVLRTGSVKRFFRDELDFEIGRQFDEILEVDKVEIERRNSEQERCLPHPNGNDNRVAGDSRSIAVSPFFIDHRRDSDSAFDREISAYKGAIGKVTGIINVDFARTGITFE